MKRSVKILWSVFFIGVGTAILIIIAADLGWLGKMPSIEELQNPSASLSSQVYADDGTLMGKYYLQDRVNVKYADISKYAIQALVATEDERFYDHSGIDPKSVARAVFLLGSQGGGSTITMQTAKNLFTDYTTNILVRIPQKIKEGIIAIKLERNFTKEEIITLYLNTVPFSDNVYGIRNAAKTFFQKEPDQLTVSEAATLIGMVNAPTAYNPRLYPARAKDRRDFILNKMVNSDYLKQGEADALIAKPIVLNYKKLNENTGLAPYFRMVLGEEMKQWCKTHTKANGDHYNLYQDGLKIYTTINPKMQLYAEEAVAKHMAYMQKILNSQHDIKSGSVWKEHENVLNAAMQVSDRWKNLKEQGLSDDDIKKTFYQKTNMKVFAWNNAREIDTVMTPYDSIKYCRQMLECGFMSMDPLSGYVKSWVGGIDFKNFKFDHVNINTRRQVGSTIKPLLYSLAIEDAGFTPNTMVQDVQQSFGEYGTVPATGASCTGRTMPMSQALMWSRNCATAYIMKQLSGSDDGQGAKRFLDFLKNCSVQTKNIQPYPSIALGSCEISLYEMLQAYSMFPGRGFNVKPMYITRIEDKNGNVLETHTSQRKEVISDVTAYFIINMMQGVVKFGTGRRIWSYGVKGSVAGKTGTTNDNSDAWFIGYTPQLLCGVWSGCDDRFIRFSSTTNGQGASAALPVWGYFYNKVANDKTLPYSDTADFAKPDVGVNEPNYDYINNTQIDLGAQGDNIGNGQSSDYEQGYDNTNPQNITPESNTQQNQYDDNTSPTGESGNQQSNGGSKNPPKKDNSKQPADTPQKPKALMPKKDGGGN
ncbi:MAG: transglycosylase domain-containing protein [Parafilimonas sp.]|nr:transglycosylase domain-containing protein [Parafilimonas sp.]